MFGYAGPFQLTAATVMVLIGVPVGLLAAGVDVAVAALAPLPPSFEDEFWLSPPPHAAITAALARIATITPSTRHRCMRSPALAVSIPPAPLAQGAQPRPVRGDSPI